MTDWKEYEPDVAPDTWIEVKGRYGDIYGPLPFALFAPDAWDGEMFHAAHDLVAWRAVNRG